MAHQYAIYKSVLAALLNISITAPHISHLSNIEHLNFKTLVNTCGVNHCDVNQLVISVSTLVTYRRTLRLEN